jgi:two-component system, LuxR family, response regulator FixJ
MNGSRPVVRLVDDDPSFLSSVERLLRASGYVVKTFASAEEFLAAGDDSAGCVVVDLRMPGMDGLGLQRALKQGDGGLPIIFLTGEGDIPISVKAMRQGAEDFLTKGAPNVDLLAAVERAIARDATNREERDRFCALRAQFDRLTARELEVLRHVIDGSRNKEIAGTLGINERTVKLHRTAITTKLQVRSVAEITKLVQAAKLFDDDRKVVGDVRIV